MYIHVGSSPVIRTRKELRAEKLVVLFVLYLVLSGLEVGAVVNEAPVELQSRE